MATELAKAYVQIIPSAQGIQGKIAEVLEPEMGSAGKAAGEKFSGGFGGVLRTGGVIVAGVSEAMIGLTKDLVSGAESAAEYGDNIDKMSQKLGLSAESYQKWDYVIGQAGGDIDSMSTGLKTLTNKLDDAKNGSDSASAMFAQLGLSMEELNSMSREEVFEQVIFGFQGMADSTERAALANDLFGRSGQELTPLFNSTVEETKGLMQAAEDLGFVMSDDAVKASADFSDALSTLQRTFGGLSKGLLSELMPGLTTVMDGLSQIFAGNGEAGIAMISEGIDSILTGLSDKLPQFLELGLGIVESLLDAIVENLPKIMENGAEILGKLTAGLIQALPKLVAAAPQIIISIIKGLAASFPEIIAAGADIVQKIKDGFMKAVSAAKTWGQDLINNFIAGIKAKWDALKQSVANIAKTVKDFLGFSEPEEGPLSDFHTFAPDMMELFAKGIRDNLGIVQGAVQDAATATNAGFTKLSTSNGVGVAQGNGDVISAIMTGATMIVQAIEASGGGNVDWNGVASALWKPMQRQNQIHGQSLVSYSL